MKNIESKRAARGCTNTPNIIYVIWVLLQIYFTTLPAITRPWEYLCISQDHVTKKKTISDKLRIKDIVQSRFE